VIDDALREYAEMPDLFAPIPEGSSVSREDDGRICILQGSIWASISAPRFEEHELDDVIAHVHARVAPEKRQTWWIGPSARPANIVSLLRARGFGPAADSRKLCKDLDLVGRQADLLLGLAQSCREQRGVVRVSFPARECELAAVQSAVGANDQHEPKLPPVVAKDGDEDGRGAAPLAHARLTGPLSSS